MRTVTIRAVILLLALAGVLLLVLSSPDRAQAADTNGDGLVDQVAVCQGNKICVTRGGSGQVITYSDPNWNSVSINSVKETNGVIGDDIVVVATNGFGAFQCICIIHDRVGGISQYRDPQWSSVSINSVVDTDGNAGADVVLVVTNSLGTFQCICIIHDRVGSFSSYRDSSNWRSVTIAAVADTDGNAGADVVLVTTNSSGAFWCVCVIHDRIGTYSTYRDSANWSSVTVRAVTDTDGTVGSDIVLLATNSSGAFWCVCVIHDRTGGFVTYRDFSNWGTVSINSVVDTNGVVGAEVIVIFAKVGGSPGISMIRDRNGNWQNYFFPGNFTVRTVQNTDGQPGAEVCSSLQLGGFIRITDRTGSQQNVAGCP